MENAAAFPTIQPHDYYEKQDTQTCPIRLEKNVSTDLDNFNTLNRESRLMLHFLSTLAEWESQAKSESMEWSIVRRFKDRKFLTPTNYLLGYDRDANKKLIIEEDGANTVRAIYKAFLAGYSLKDIAFVLSDYGRPTGKGNTVWGAESVRRILLKDSSHLRKHFIAPGQSATAPTNLQ